ncbi:MAG: hypothetical protein LIO41_04840 [Ruminococcus sp.]|nr:hypothetical protein [Ruminococcus sp.]MCD7772452.1 hypothetical protein [Ruminococcus sp.]
MKINDKQLETLLSVASKKLNTSPETLKSQLESGVFDQALSSMNKTDAERLTKALSDPKVAQKILSTPQAQEIYKKLSK